MICGEGKNTARVPKSKRWSWLRKEKGNKRGLGVRGSPNQKGNSCIKDVVKFLKPINFKEKRNNNNVKYRISFMNYCINYKY